MPNPHTLSEAAAPEAAISRAAVPEVTVPKAAVAEPLTGEARLRAAIRRLCRRCGRPHVRQDAPPQRVTLLRLLTTRCSAEDLRTLCFVLGINHEVLPGAGKAAHARELVAYFDRRQDLEALEEALTQLRPDLADEVRTEV